jgi:hypothetical protein
MNPELKKEPGKTGPGYGRFGEINELLMLKKVLQIIKAIF